VRLDSLGEMSVNLWRPPLALASVLFILSGPAHALGRIDAVFYAALMGVTLAAVSVPLGLMALRVPEPAPPTEKPDDAPEGEPA
jgi:hypothetical protein